MNKDDLQKITKNIIEKISPENTKYAVRDITLLSAAIFGKSHFQSFEKIFKVNFSIIYWFQKSNSNFVFHRSGLEYDSFSKKIGNKFIKNPNYAKKTANALIQMSNEINSFIRINRNLNNFSKKWEHFFKLYMDFFAYHQAVFWPSEYLANLKVSGSKAKKIKRIIGILGRAYKYNEQVIPSVDHFFRKLKVGHLLPEEISGNILQNIRKKSKGRSILFLSRAEYTLQSNDAKKIDWIIFKKYEKYLKSMKQVQGIGVSPGVVSGKVRLIRNLSNLNKVKSGDILVVSQTRPQFNYFIKKSAAIITDEGGLLSHASILARENKIPCIVGTKNASHMLKDGDLVEVDADWGVVRILKKKAAA